MAQRLNRRSVEDADEKRATRFFADARLPLAERAELEDYKRSGYSRGHMAPAGDMPTATAMEQSFSLANMVPQDIQHNGGAWAKIEQDTRHYARRAKGDEFVITGPVFTPQSPKIGQNGVKVPTYLFSRPLKKSGRTNHCQSSTSQKGLQAIFQELVRGEPPRKSPLFEPAPTFSTAC